MSKLVWCVVLCLIGLSEALIRTACPAVRLKHGRARYRQKGGFVQSSCNPGYILAGDRYMKCQKGAWEGTVPVCVRDTCNGQRAPINGFVYPSHRGGVLNFFCKPGYELVGTATAFCDGVSWSTHLPICSESNKTVSLSCDFEAEDICGWTHDLNHNFDWTRHSRSTPSSFIGTGPYHDHTLGSNQDGHYMYIEASAKNPNDTARLISPVYTAQDNLTCLVFWYHMYGVSMGSLLVYLRPVSRRDWTFDSNDALWRRVGDHGPRWLRGFIDLSSMKGDFQVIFEAVRGGNYMSDTAIDDVSLTENCNDMNIDDATTTTEENTSGDGRAYLESWSCYNRCEMGHPGDTCSCLSSCYEQQTCCPDYEAYCLEFESTPSSTSTDVTTIWWTDDVRNIETSESEQFDIDIATNATTTSTTNRAATTEKQNYIPPVLLPPKIKPPPQYFPPKTPNSYATSVLPVLKTKAPKKYFPSKEPLIPAPIIPSVNPPKPIKPSKIVPPASVNDLSTHNEVVHNEKHSLDEKAKENIGGFAMSKVVIICGASMVVLIFLVTVIKLRRRVSRACESIRMRRGTSCDSQSDVRFLTSDEILDFSLASSTL